MDDETDFDATHDDPAPEVLDRGVYCQECGWYETGDLDGTDICNGCGCAAGSHVPAKVVQV